ncbi:MAG TPA: hypothetical protein VKJ07_21055, partial [Mycobacteriales bacterium]|nr:hypothetical protein [Mycobacteriales bacterium]
EGGGGNDVIFGNQNQDDIVGGSSTLFSLTDPKQRPDGSDLIFGGSGTNIARNDCGAATTDTANSSIACINAPTGHASDSDAIAGDNANVYRLVGVNRTYGLGTAVGYGQIVASNGFLQFNYDQSSTFENRGTTRIVPRGVELVDYTLGGPDLNAASVAAHDAGRGGADEIHGENGDDFVYGQQGNDVLFGDGQNDDLIAGWGNDWVSAGTGEDAALGDDGRIFTSRNSAVYGEPLYGVIALLATDPDTKFSNGNVLNEFIYTPGMVQTATINVGGVLKRAVDLAPFNPDPTGAQDSLVQDPWFQPLSADDILFGGLGNDAMHGGSGDDSMSGAEALPLSFLQVPTSMTDNTFLRMAESDYFHPYNPGNTLRFDPVDPAGAKGPVKRDNRGGQFALYDEGSHKP